jgi:hypothetical protein
MTTTHKIDIHQSHGRGSTTMDVPGDILVSASFNITLITGKGESPSLHREQMRSAINALHKSLEDCLCGNSSWNSGFDEEPKTT